MELLKKLKRKSSVPHRKMIAEIAPPQRRRDGPVVFPRRDAAPIRRHKPFLKKVWEGVRTPASLFKRQRAPKAGPGPKNGWLALGLLASFAMTVILGTLSMRLIQDPSVATKAFGPAPAAQTDLALTGAGVCPPIAMGGAKPGEGPPQVTFYSKLRQEDRPPEPEPISGKIDEKDLSTPAREGSPNPAATKVAEKTEARIKREAQKPARGAFNDPDHDARGLTSTGKVFSVQVGAFSHPAVAKQWAEKWRARGYDVILKPIARPRSGVIYRLYLGSFPNAKKADELVSRLKSKEGVTAFAVALK